MSTINSILLLRYEETGQGHHVYRDGMDRDDIVHVELRGVMNLQTKTIAPGLGKVCFSIHKDWADKLFRSVDEDKAPLREGIE